MSCILCSISETLATVVTLTAISVTGVELSPLFEAQSVDSGDVIGVKIDHSHSVVYLRMDRVTSSNFDQYQMKTGLFPFPSLHSLHILGFLLEGRPQPLRCSPEDG